MTGDMISKDDTASGEAEPSTPPPETGPPTISPLKAKTEPERAEIEQADPEQAEIVSDRAVSDRAVSDRAVSDRAEVEIEQVGIEPGRMEIGREQVEIESGRAEIDGVEPGRADIGDVEHGDVEHGDATVGAAAIEDVPELVINGAAFLHAPTGRRPDDLPFAGDFPDVPEVEYDDEEDDDDEPVIVGFDRRTDMWWLGTPIVTLLVAPLIAGLVTFVVTASDDSSPAVCRDALADNGCEEAVLRMIGQHTVAFAILWLGLWALPWYRGLRRYRVALALVAFAVLLAVPLRLVGD
jgi:hypothetical protein